PTSGLPSMRTCGWWSGTGECKGVGTDPVPGNPRGRLVEQGPEAATARRIGVMSDPAATSDRRAGSDRDGAVSRYLRHHFRHFNAASLIDAADAYVHHLDGGGHMLVTLAGAMSTAELGLSLAEMIRQDKVQIITCTGANLEEDVFNLIAHDFYERVPHYRDLTPQDEQDLLDRHMNRVTDTCIPEGEAMRRLESALLAEWMAADAAGERYFPHEFLYRLLRDGKLAEHYQIDPK